ncbi:ETC complex I subunit conserved region-domain-containing protein [Mycotypha africana]|uniref:ETC complex I subunit conserved region-domain-containing protein n=1 Tax=Mycotypha africana TaxID=64632 RepID=UPI0022FFE238|nr:ETC complex I subunit conserved region-domain-containing protein [Mycotypha africana]KAI8973822.1 ETC complex I subunit conserved region-domain-containing protein [Mycotypha africana]
MSSILIKRTAFAWRSMVNKPTVLSSTARLYTTEAKDLQHLERQPIETVDNLSGAPEALLDRQVRIFRPARTSAQQGKNGTRLWRIEFDILEDGNRWENPLIGWASSSDYEQALTMKFFTKEAAINFAEKQGWTYYVQEPHERKFVKKAYGDNYKYSEKKLRLIKCK